MSAFVRSVELGSFSKAAGEAEMKVSTVSRYISALEDDLGAALLNRSTRRLHLTEAGQSFYERAAQILADVDDARNATRSLNAHPQGLLRINIPSAFGRRHVMPHMKDFLAAYPDIRLDATLTDATVDLIETGTDIAIRIGALADSSLIAKRLAPQRRVLVASPHYLQTALASALAEPADLMQHQCLAFALQVGNAWFYRPTAEPQADPVEMPIKGNLRTNDSEALLDAALSGLGIALLPTWLVSGDLQSGRLVTLLADWEWSIASGPQRAIWAVYPPKKVVSPKVRAFLTFMSERFGSPLPYWDAQRAP
ncbi:LysR family transcriptional regulator [Rhizobium lusitanum]|nr:LysR family transcriptional regulator [Rhizobium lusitanum]